MKNIYPPIDPEWANITDRLFERMASTMMLVTRRGAPILNQEEAQLQILHGCAELCSMLLYKNKRYGNSALSPDEEIPTGALPSTLIKIRINDKLKRLKMGDGNETEDLYLDLLGYIVLLRIALHNEGRSQ
jgi:hypothetical protein